MNKAYLQISHTILVNISVYVYLGKTFTQYIN